MKLLLDTHILLWAVSDPHNLTPKIQQALASEEITVFVSMASLWELRIKESIQKISLPDDFYQQLIPAGYELLPIHLSHIERLGQLPLYHRDPFDRLLIAQALQEKLILVTEDQEIKKYQAHFF